MRRLIYTIALYSLYLALTPIFQLGPALAQSVNSGASPELRSTLADGVRGARRPGDGASQTVAVGVAAGYSTNAGPTLQPDPSAFFETSALVLNSRSIAGGTLALQADVTAREYSTPGDARNGTYALKGSFDANDQTFAIAVSAEQRLDIEEDVRIVSLSGRRTFGGASSTWTPFIRGDIAYLDYADVDALFLEFANQDDRDRASATGEAGIRRRLNDSLSVSITAGANAKAYSARRDDFLLARNNASAYAAFGLEFADGKASASLTYAPVYRWFAEETFAPLFAHTVSASASAALTSDVSIYAKTRIGLEETDFLNARAYEDGVAVAGIMVALPHGASTNFDAAYTRRRFHGVERHDKKYELQWRAQAPLNDRWKLTAQAGYLYFASNFGEATLDQTTVTLGLVHTLQ